MSSRSRTSETASNVLLLRGILPTFTTDVILDSIKVFGPVLNIRLIHDKETGKLRNFAFAEFSSPKEAHDIIAMTGGKLYIESAEIALEFSHNYNKFCSSGGYSNSSSPTENRDWTCPLCRTFNFSRRDLCFSCKAPRPALEPYDPLLAYGFSSGNSMIQTTNQTTTTTTNDPNSEEETNLEMSSVIVVRGLRTYTTEKTISEYYQRLNVPVKEVRIAKDRETGESRGVAFVEFFCIEDARIALIGSNQHRIESDGKPVSVMFSRDGPSSSRFNNRHKNPQQQGHSHSHSHSHSQSQSQSHSQSQSQSQPQIQQSQTTEAYYQALAAYYQSLGEWSAQAAATITTTTTKEEKPQNEDLDDQLSALLTEVSSGATQTEQQITQGKEKKLIVASAAPSTSLSSNPNPNPNPNINQNLTTTTTTTIVTPPKDRRLVAEMEKWSKRQQELHSSPPSQQQQQQQQQQHKQQQMQMQTQQQKTVNVVSGNVCLLCKRQFANEEALEKHIKLSQLHKQNLELKAKEEQEKQENETQITTQQRDRAAERRALYNQPEHPTPPQKRQKQQEETLPTSTSTPTSIGAPITSTSVEKPISEDNVGSKMLRRMGWHEGEGLGQSSNGTTAPISITPNGAQHAGVGIFSSTITSSSTTTSPIVINPSDDYKTAGRKIMMRRFGSLQ